MLIIRNPATGATIAELQQDDAQSVSAKYLAARAAQPAWAAQPLPNRIDVLRRFRDALTSDVERLAAVLTSETGKPIRQSRNEIKGSTGRIDFFLGSTEGTIATRAVHTAASMREQISHEPLGVVANISAWNYPYFVGGNVFVPALLTGNAVLYKPSEFATLTGIEIGKTVASIRCSAAHIRCARRRRSDRIGVDQTTDRRRIFYRLVCDRAAHRARSRTAHAEAAARARRQGPDLRSRRCRRCHRCSVAG